MRRMSYIQIAEAVPNGKCWCDCGGETKPGNFWLPGGHDKRAARYLAVVEGTTLERLANLGYNANGQLRLNTLAKSVTYQECGRLNLRGQPCLIIGENPGIRQHRADSKQHSD